MSCLNNMQDQRSFTDYTPNCQLNQIIFNKYNQPNSSEYRLFLQRNACKIMNELRQRTTPKNPTGCECNYVHPPHDYETEQAFNYVITPEDYARKYADFGKQLPALGRGDWHNYC